MTWCHVLTLLVSCSLLPVSSEPILNFSDDRKLSLQTSNTVLKSSAISILGSSTTYYQQVSQARELIIGGSCDKGLKFINEALNYFADDGDLWLLKGICLQKLARHKEAVSPLIKALELGFTPWDAQQHQNPNDIMIRIAASFAQLGNTEQAVKWLKLGIKQRYDDRLGIAKLAEFDSLKANEDFKKLALIMDTQDLSRVQGWQLDLALLAEQVNQLHIDPDQSISEERLIHLLVEIEQSIPELTDQQILAHIDLFIGALGGGHDLFWPVSAKKGALMPFALKVYWFNDGLYIIDAYDPSLIGSKIEYFNHTSANDAYIKVAKAFPGDNDMHARWMSARHLTQAYTLEVLGIVDDANDIKLTIVDEHNRRRQVIPKRKPFTPMSPALKAQDSGKIPLYLSQLDNEYWLKLLPEISALYVQLNEVGNKGNDEESLQAFAKRMGQTARSSQAKHLILDLRHSHGGNGYLLPHLLRELIAFETLSSQHKLYVIIGRNTFSASQNLITDLDWISDPIFVGEPSGSRPNAPSESGQLYLPYSGARGLLSSQFHQHSWPEDHRIWIAPDIPVALTSKAYFAGKDPAMDAISKLITLTNKQ